MKKAAQNLMLGAVCLGLTSGAQALMDPKFVNLTKDQITVEFFRDGNRKKSLNLAPSERKFLSAALLDGLKKITYKIKYNNGVEVELINTNDRCEKGIKKDF